MARDGMLCPMSRGEYNKFGYKGYIKIIIDGRGQQFCDDCAYFLNKIYGYKCSAKNILKDAPLESTRYPINNTETI
jgi:hypothetical protein